MGTAKCRRLNAEMQINNYTLRAHPTAYLSTLCVLLSELRGFYTLYDKASFRIV